MIAPANSQPESTQWIDELSISQIRTACLQAMLRVLTPYGFVLESGPEAGLLLSFPGGLHRISVPIAEDHPGYRFSFVLASRLDAVAAVTGLPICSLVHYDYFDGRPGKQYLIDSLPGLALAATEMNLALVNRVLPLLDQISDVNGLERLYNGPATVIPFQRDKGDGRVALALAKLAGNPAYAKLCEHYRQAGGANSSNEREQSEGGIANLQPAAAAPPSSADGAHFIANYNGTQRPMIDMAPGGADPHAPFRAELVRHGGTRLERFSLRLVRDMFEVQAKACTAGSSFNTPAIVLLTTALLSRGGVGELALFAQSIPMPALPAFSRMPLDAEMANALRYASEERQTNPMFAQWSQQYAVLAPFFGGLAG